VNNIESTIQVGGHTPKVVLLDIGVQLIILGVYLTKKMGMLDSKLQNQELCLHVKCLVTNATNYDVFTGQKALFPLGFTIDNWFVHAYYQMDWETDGHHLGYIPFNLHGNHSPMVHHCMLKEAHTIFYIQQPNHEWITEDEEETAYAQATKSLRVVRIGIQHGP